MTRRPPPRSQRARRTARRSEEPAATRDRRERFDRARTARMIVKVKRERLALELQRGRLVARDRVERQAFAFARGLRRHEEAIGFLLSLVADGAGPDARDAIAALGTYRHDEVLRARVATAIEARTDVSLRTAFARVF